MPRVSENQIFKSGFETKGAAQSALRKAIAEYETKSGKLIEEIGLLGRRTWAYVLGEKTAGGFESRSAAEDALKAEIDRQQAQIQPAVPAAAPTFAEYFRYWIEEHAARRCSPKTLSDTENSDDISLDTWERHELTISQQPRFSTPFMG